jgi:hypothetical protein
MTSALRTAALENSSPAGFDLLGFAATHLSSAALAGLTRLQDALVRAVRPLLDDAWKSATGHRVLRRCRSRVLVEGTHEINAPTVGRALTGSSAFA